MKPVELTCEYAKNPLGIDTPQPRFGWLLESAKRGCRQTAYQILLASSEEKLKNDIADRWDSKKVISDESVNITYQGASLVSAEKCYWKVRIWNQDEDVSVYSSPAIFEMGLLKKSDWQGEWIGAKKGISAPLLRKEFAIKKTITKARAYICGLGFYELYINGSRVGNHLLDPATTDYDKRLLYVPYDVIDLLKPGQNVVGVILGNGWFCEPPESDVVLNRRMCYRYGDSPRVIIQMNLAFTDGSTSSIVTDRTWRTSSGPIVKNDLYGGETYDARLEKPGWNTAGYEDSGWVEALAKEITGTLYPRKYMPLFWTKWLKDIKSAQDEKGQIPDIAPNYVNPGAASDVQPSKFIGDPAWGGNYPILVWYLYQYYGDKRLLKEHYQGMKRCVDYLGTQAQDYIVSKGHYGDHMLPGKAPGKEEFISSETPPPLVWTGYYYRDAGTVAEAAKVLGYQEDSEEYARLAEDIKQAFNKKWLNKDTCQYATGSQTANAFPLALGIVPQELVQGLLQNLTQTIVEKHQGHLHTGNTGTTCLIDTLTTHGQGEVMFRIVNQTSYPGWGFMVEEGATTIWESWSLKSTVGDSESMIMWATIDEFFYNDLAGIKGPDYYGPNIISPGFKDILIEPHPLGDLNQAAANIKTVRGLLSSSWKREDHSFTLEVIIPTNSRALIRIPKLGMKKIKVTESKNLIWQEGGYLAGAEGITGGRESSELVSFEVGSGTYTFHLAGQ